MKFLDVDGLKTIKPFSLLSNSAIVFVIYFTDRRSPFIKLPPEVREQMARQVSGYDGKIDDKVKEAIETYKQLDWDPIDNVVDAVNNKIAVVSNIINNDDNIAEALAILEQLLDVRLKIEKIINEMTKDSSKDSVGRVKSVGATRGNVDVPWLEKIRRG